MRIYNNKRRNEFRQWVAEMKSTIGCSCGEKDSRCLDFHHIDSSTKEFSIAQRIGWASYSKEKFLEEIDKCQILCSNCHRKIHG